jgi:hypothetical protein
MKNKLMKLCFLFLIFYLYSFVYFVSLFFYVGKSREEILTQKEKILPAVWTSDFWIAVLFCLIKTWAYYENCVRFFLLFGMFCFSFTQLILIISSFLFSLVVLLCHSETQTRGWFISNLKGNYWQNMTVVFVPFIPSLVKWLIFFLCGSFPKCKDCLLNVA